MSPRLIGSCLGIASALALAVTLVQPFGLGPLSEAADEVEVEPVSKDLNVITGDSPFFVTFRPADFLSDSLVKALGRDIRIEMERELRVALDEVERVTMVAMARGPVMIIRTKKPSDDEKLRGAFVRERFERKDGGPGKQATSEKKVGSKTVYFSGGLNRWTQGYCPLDKHSYMTGPANEIISLLGGKARRSSQMSAAVKLASEHSLVLAVDGKALRNTFKKMREDEMKQQEEFRKERDFERFRDKDKAIKDGVSVKLDPRLAVRQARQDKDETSADDEIDELLKADRFMAFSLLPFKALLKLNFGLVTMDVKKGYKLNGKVSFANKDDTDDGETVLKYFLYVGREMVRTLPKLEPELEGFVPLVAPIHKVMKEGKIERKDNTLTLSLSYTPDAGMAKKVGEAIEAARKKYRNFDKKDKIADKGKFVDKVKEK